MKKILNRITATAIISAIIIMNFLNPVAIAASGIYDSDSNNLFVFEQWASNENSTAVGPVATDGTLTKDTATGSFTLTNNTASGEVYTCHSMDSNDGYYSMSVEPGAQYAFQYNANGTATSFESFVFYFNESGTFISFENCAETQFGSCVWEFTTPENAAYIQIRFDNNTPGSYIAVSDIRICKIEIYELAFENLFVFEQWANHPLSGVINSGLTGGELTKDISAGSLTLTNNSTTGEIYTSHSMGSTSGYYSMPVKPNTSYIFEYNADGAITSFETFVFYFNSLDTFISFDCAAATQYGHNMWSFTTPENASFIQVRFDNNITGTDVTVSDIRICESEVYECAKDNVFRKTYTYSGSGDVYGELPALEKEGLVFAGWYTAPDGTGDKITADTVIRASSYSLYAKWEPILSEDITIVSLPDKQEYCVGEKLNTKGLSIFVTYMDGTTDILESGFYCSPQVMSEAGEQVITITYGDKSAEFAVTVKEALQVSVNLNGSAITVPMANYKYTIGKTVSSFNRYEIGYSSDAYVKATMLMGATVEEFFLEPAQDGVFSGYIDGFLDGTTQTQITSITFTALDNDFMDFALESVTTSQATSLGDSDGMVYLSDNNYKIGIDLDWGGALTYLEDKTNSVMSSVKKYGTKVTEVDFKSKVSTSSLSYNTSSSVNLINCNDTGRLVQQSYYGTGSPPYEIGDYNGTPWNYNPVQGGNVKNEASKIVDLKVTDNEIYVKCRPLDWGKYSDEFAAANNLEAKYGGDYITPSYMEAWYTLEDGLMRATCRFVDYSGYPEATTTQELPAFYCVEPLNNFVYYSGGEPWSDSNTKITQSSLQFWGDYPDQFFDCNENWAAFIGDDADSFGIGLYCPGQANMLTGVFSRDGCTSVSPATESPTSYIAAVDTFTFKSFNPFSYAYYITTGNVDTIRNNFKAIATNPADPCNVGYTNGFCNNCGKYEVPTLTTDKYDLNDDGNKDSVYEIANAGQLFWFRDTVNAGATSANAVVTADIVVNNNLLDDAGNINADAVVHTWSPIGSQTGGYSGIFHGQGHTISGLHYSNVSENYAGLFGYTTSSAIIKELGVTDSYITANSYVGGVCGSNGGTIINCYSKRSVINASTYGGGIAGANTGCVSNCYSTASVYGTSYVGGICGNNTSDVSNCYYVENGAFNSAGVIQNGIGASGESSSADDVTKTAVKTLDEFYSGEVAYLLQKYNSTQIWGQKSNIKNSSPVFDYSGQYKVIAFGSADCYSIAYVGDVECDDDIDVSDYQQLANMAVSENLDTANFKNFVRCDLTCDGSIDVLDCYVMALMLNDHKGGITVYPIGDFDFDGVAFTKSDVTAIKKGLINQSTLASWQKYACDLNSDGALDSKDQDVLDEKTQTSTEPIFIDMTDSISLKTKTANVIILCGQSNAYGASPLTDAVRATVGNTDFSNIKIKYNNINSDDGINNWRTHYSNNAFETFRLGIGGQADSWFGPEVGISYHLATNEATKDEMWYIIKYTAAGTYLGGNWIYDAGYNNASNSQNIYDSLGGYLSDLMLDYVDTSLDEIVAIHGVDKTNIRAFMWHQGESDSCVKEWADQYGSLQSMLVNKVRTAFEPRDLDNTIGFVDGGIAAYDTRTFDNPLTGSTQTYNGWAYSDTINTHKSNLANLWYVPANTDNNIINTTTAGLYQNSTTSTKLANSIWIDTSTCKSKYVNNNENGEYDGAHYCGESMFYMGIWYAQGMLVV